VRFGAHRAQVGKTPETTQTLKAAKGDYYQILLKAIEAGAAYWKPDLNVNLCFDGHVLQKPVLNEVQHAALLATANQANPDIKLAEASSRLKSFIFCRQQERKLENTVDRMRIDAVAEIHRLSLEKNYETTMPKGVKVLIVPMIGKTPALVKNHPDHQKWQQSIQQSQEAAIQLEKSLAKQGLTETRYTPYSP